MASPPTPPDDPFPQEGDFEARKEWFARRLEGRSREDCILIAARAALRVLPMLSPIILNNNKKDQKERLENLISPFFYCVLICTPYTKNYGSKIFDILFIIADEVERITSKRIPLSVFRYAESLYSSVRVIFEEDYHSCASETLASSTTNSLINNYLLDEFIYDIKFLEKNKNLFNMLIFNSIWAKNIEIPKEIKTRWDLVVKKITAYGNGWDVWLEWYGGGYYKGSKFNGVLQGSDASGNFLFGLKSERALKLWSDSIQLNEIWLDLPDNFNIAFRRLVEKAREEEQHTTATESNQKSEQLNLTEEQLLKSLQADPHGAPIVLGQDDRFHIDKTGSASDVDAWSKPAVPQLHQEALRKLRALLEPNCAARLSNDPTWSGLAGSATLVLALLNQDQAGLANAIGTGWSLSVDLASWLDLDGQLRKSPNGMRDPLAEDVRRPLLSAVETLAVFIRQFPTARQLDEELGAFNSPPDQNAVIGRLVNSIRQAQLLAEEDQQVFEAAYQASQNEGVQANKARGWITASVKNVVVGGGILIAGGAAHYGTGFLEGAGAIHAQKSPIVGRVSDLLAKKEEEFLKLFENTPADNKIAIQEIIRRAKEQGATPSIQKKQD